MSFNDGAELDLSNVQSGGGGGRMAVGGGAALLIAVVGMVLGVDTSSLLGAVTGSGSGQSSQGVGDLSRCKTGKEANADIECRVVGAANSAEVYWAAELPRYGKKFSPAKLVIYSGQTSSACGPASNAVGPFYCPSDKKMYIDASFFKELTQRFGADDGALAQEYVVAHEYGHYIQDLLGVLGRAQSDRQGADSGAVRVELMADCFAGMWARGAATTPSANGTTFLKPLTDRDIQSALSAASAVGDDRIQEKVQGRVNPEAWTHGSAAQRQRWFTIGYETGDLNKCNTFAANPL
jgi:uncharacterized protein